MSETGALAQISQARRFLEQAKDLTDIKAVRDMAEAARLYARAAGLGQDAMNEAAEIKLRAERKAGEALKARPMNRGGQPAHRKSTDSPRESVEASLVDDGITPKQSMQWQDEAALPESVFEEIVSAAKDAGKPLTSKAVAQRGRQHKQQQADAAMARSRTAPRTAAERASPINAQNIQDARLRSAFSRALAGASEISALSASRVLEVLAVADADRADAALARLAVWLERFREARAASGPRMIGGLHG